MIEATSCSQSLVLSEIDDFLELRKFFRRIADEVAEDILVIVADQNDFFDARNFRYRS